MRLNPLVAALVLIASVWALESAQANFGDAIGFSGRSGATCLACHTPTPALAPPATVSLEGLPVAWETNTTYSLTMRVDGGPQAMPAPQPQGGFALASSGGTFVLVAGTQDIMFLSGDTEVGYLPQGTLQREWTVDWVAPELAVQPSAQQFWLAVLSANGNHVIASGGADDGGERFDSEAHLTVIVPPSDAALAAWRAIPLRSPEATATLEGGTGLIEGRHLDANATALAYSIDGALWTSRETGGSWRITLADLEAGEHTIGLRSEGADRVSREVTLHLDVDGVFGPLLPRDTPSTGAPALALILTALALGIRKHLP